MRAALLACAVATNAWAFQVGTAFTDPCHERLTTRAFQQTLASWPDAPADAPSELEQKLATDLARTFAPDLDASAHYALFSLLVGVRSPDCEGHSLIELQKTRLIHVPAEDQYGHALRNASDDGQAGDAAAINGARAVITSMTGRARAEEYVTVQYFVDGYGLLAVKLWAPAYFLGRAAHATQDSFSHTLRDNDFHTVRHVMNYADALTPGFDEPRDGLRHSGEMDSCDSDENAPITDAAVAATAQLMQARGSDTQVQAMLDDWLATAPGCTLDNDYCDSPWLEFAREDATHSYLGCSSGSGALALAALALLRRKKR